MAPQSHNLPLTQNLNQAHILRMQDCKATLHFMQWSWMFSISRVVFSQSCTRDTTKKGHDTSHHHLETSPPLVGLHLIFLLFQNVGDAQEGTHILRSFHLSKAGNKMAFRITFFSSCAIIYITSIWQHLLYTSIP